MDNQQAETEVPKDTLFEARGFAQESAEPEGEELTAEQADALIGKAPAVAAAEVTPEAAEPEEEKAPIKIGSREFKNQAEAFAYAQELEQEKLANDAFRHGVEVASQTPQGNPAPAAQQAEELDPEFYTDPQSYMRKRDARIAAEIEARVHGSIEMKERNAQTWDGFYKNYPDLASVRKLVDITFKENFERLKHVKLEVALKEIADKARAFKQEITEASMPGKTLAKVTQAASAGKGTGVTPQAKEEPVLNFTQQLRNMRKTKAQRMRR